MQQQQLPGFAFAAAPNFGLNLTTALTSASLQAMSDFNRELAKFVSHRLEQDAALQAELATCTCPFAAFDCMAEFWKRAVTEYAQEAKAMQTLASTTAGRSMHTVEEGLRPEATPILD